MKRWLYVFFGLAILISACKEDTPKPPESSNGGTTDPANDDNNNGKPDNATQPKDVPETIVGRWMLTATTQNRRTGGFAEQPLGLFEFSREDGGSYKARMLDAVMLDPEGKLEFSDVKPTRVSLLLSDESTKLNIQGKLTGEDIRCSVKTSDFDDRVFAMTMKPSTLESLEEAEMEPISHGDELMKALQSQTPVEKLRAFASQHQDEVLAIFAYRTILDRFAARNETSVDDVHAIVREYQQAAATWDERVQRQAIFDAGTLLASSGYDPDVVLQYLDEAETQLAEEEMETRKPLIARARVEAQSEKARRQLQSTDLEMAAKGYETLQEMNEKQPFEFKNLFALAQYAEKNDQVDDALRYYADLVVVPNMEMFLIRHLQEEVGVEPEAPSAALQRLWNEKHGNLDGVDEYLNEIYEENIYHFADEKQPPREPDDGNRVVLAELFTGTQCPPCMAADVALGAVEQTYPTEDVIALRYHLHIPRPDPLTNNSSEARRGFYGVSGTPTIFLNGGSAPFVGGFTMSHAEDGYRKLLNALEPTLAEEAKVTIKANITLKGDAIDINATADGFDTANENLKLRLVLAENLVRYQASNGIRLHEMVVRSMPGGAEGIAAKEGKLAFRTSIPLNNLKSEITDYIAQFERTNPLGNFREVPLDMHRLTLVAFVQDDSDKTILQSKAVRLESELTYPDPEETPVEFEPATTPPVPPLPVEDNKMDSAEKAESDTSPPGNTSESRPDVETRAKPETPDGTEPIINAESPGSPASQLPEATPSEEVQPETP